MRHGERQRGFSYVMMVAALALVGIALAAAGQAWSEQQRRAREQHLLHVGAAYLRAIQSYYDSSPGTQKVLPMRLDELLQDNRYAGMKRHLRQLYADPITGGDEWGLVRTSSGAIAGVYSLSERPSLANGTLTVAGHRVRFGGRYRDAQFVFVPEAR
jgi:type II secretory pathway pseudopilin PulG